jgi:hypothetical protein
MNYLRFSQPKLGSFPVVCAREGGANTTPFQVAHFALRNTKNKTGEKKTSNRAKPEKQKGKKEGGLGEGIFALLRLRIERFRFSLIKRNTKQKNFLFLLKEKIAREKIKKCRENFSVLVPPKRSGGGRKRTSLFWILFKESSNIVQKTPPIFTFCEIVRGCLGAKRLGMVFFRYCKGFFEIARQRAVGNAEVRRAKLWQNEILQTNLFSFAFGERLSAFFFDCPKTNFKTIWTT